jgi:DNA-binding MarR family transcriptional regulator
MANTSLERLLIKLRIELEKLCDGFDADDANKKSNLTLKMKVLFMLSDCGELSPNYIISTLGLAKSNLTILCRSMLEEGLIASRKSETDKRNITYIITSKGEKQLKNYLNQVKLDNVNLFKTDKQVASLEKKISEVIKLLNKE